MASKNTNRAEMLTTERGVFIYPHLLKADDKFGEPQYKTGLLVDRAYADKLEKQIEEQDIPAFIEKETGFINRKREAGDFTAVQAKKKLAVLEKFANLPFEEQLDETTGEPTGKVKINFKIKAEGISRKTGRPYSNKPKMFDAQGKPCSIEPYTGAQGKVTFIISLYASDTLGVCVTLKPRAVQIIELAGGRGERGAATYGFGAEDGSFDADAMSKHEDPGAVDADSSGDAESDLL